MLARLNVLFWGWILIFVFFVCALPNTTKNFGALSLFDDNKYRRWIDGVDIEAYYPQSVAIDSDALCLLEIPLLENPPPEGPDEPISCSVDIVFFADVYDQNTNDYLGTGFNRLRIVFVVYRETISYVLILGQDLKYELASNSFLDQRAIRFLAPIYDSSDGMIKIYAQNSAGVDAFDGRDFVPCGMVKNQQIYATYYASNFSTRESIPRLVLKNDYLLMAFYTVSPKEKIIFNANAILDGDGFSLTFTRGKENLISIKDGVTASFKHIVFKDFSMTSIEYGAGASVFFDDGTVLELAASEDLQTTLTFRGQCAIQGNGHQVTLMAGGAIVVDGPESSLLLEDITINGVCGNNIRCLDNSCTISFCRVQLNLTSNYSLTCGAFVVLDSLTISGGGTFIAAGSRQNIISLYSCLKVDLNTTFTYQPTVADHNLLVMKGKSSQLWLRCASLVSSTTGLHLRGGTLTIDGRCFLWNDGARSLSEGVVFGDHTVEDKLTVDVLPGSILDIKSGVLDYKN